MLPKRLVGVPTLLFNDSSTIKIHMSSKSVTPSLGNLKMGLSYSKLPALTAEQMRLADEELIKRYAIDLLIMMENAGRSLATICRQMLGSSVKGKRIACLTGKGNKGGGALVASRHLTNWGAEVEVILAHSEHEMKEVPLRQLNILRKMGVRVSIWRKGLTLRNYELLIDGLIGYNLKDDPRPPMSEMITAANDSMTPILALDIPSGLDPTIGEAKDPCIKAVATLTLMLPKVGLMKEQSREFVGKLYLADISAPIAMYQKFGLRADTPFLQEPTVRIY